MLLRLAVIEEVELLTTMSINAFHTDYLVGGDPEDGPPDYDSVVWHEKMWKQDHLYAYLDDQENLVGGAVLFLNQKNLYIGRIFIDPKFHRKGYGYQLMLDIEKHFPNVTVFTLDTPLVNRRTNALYKKVGYKEIKRDSEIITYQYLKEEKI